MWSARLILLFLCVALSNCTESVHRRNLSPQDPAAQGSPLEKLALQYFPGALATVPSKRIFRLTRHQLDRTVRATLKQADLPLAADYFPRDPLETNYEYATHIGINAANFPSLTAWIDQLVVAVLARPASVIDCGAQGNALTCVQAQAESFVRKAFRGDATETQVAGFLKFFSDSLAEVGLNRAVGDLVRVVLNSPQFLFRYEFATHDHRLTPAQWLQSLSYTLADAPPETFGFDSSQAARLLESSGTLGVAPITQTILESAESREKLLRFFVSWLEIKEPDGFQISKADFPEFTSEVEEAVVKETNTFLKHQLSRAAPSLRDLTQSTQSFVSDSIAFIYASSSSRDGDVPIGLDPTQRLGIFSQSAVIASHSGPTTTRLVKRGVFFVRKVMCLPLAEPQDANLTLPTDSGTSQRQKVHAATNQPQCLGCHSVINPMGFFLENYNVFGKWQDRDNGVPVDVSISTNILESGPLNTSTTVDALKAFTSSTRFEQCFVRQLFRYYMGRTENSGDHPTLRKMFLQFSSGDQNILSLLSTLAASDRLSHRTEN